MYQTCKPLWIFSERSSKSFREGKWNTHKHVRMSRNNDSSPTVCNVSENIACQIVKRNIRLSIIGEKSCCFISARNKRQFKQEFTKSAPHNATPWHHFASKILIKYYINQNVTNLYIPMCCFILVYKLVLHKHMFIVLSHSNKMFTMFSKQRLFHNLLTKYSDYFHLMFLNDFVLWLWPCTPV